MKYNIMTTTTTTVGEKKGGIRNAHVNVYVNVKIPRLNPSRTGTEPNKPESRGQGGGIWNIPLGRKKPPAKERELSTAEKGKKGENSRLLELGNTDDGKVRERMRARRNEGEKG